MKRTSKGMRSEVLPLRKVVIYVSSINQKVQSSIDQFNQSINLVTYERRTDRKTCMGRRLVETCLLVIVLVFSCGVGGLGRSSSAAAAAVFITTLEPEPEPPSDVVTRDDDVSPTLFRMTDVAARGVTTGTDWLVRPVTALDAEVARPCPEAVEDNVSQAEYDSCRTNTAATAGTPAEPAEPGLPAGTTSGTAAAAPGNADDEPDTGGEPEPIAPAPPPVLLTLLANAATRREPNPGPAIPATILLLPPPVEDDKEPAAPAALTEVAAAAELTAAVELLLCCRRINISRERQT